MFGFIGMWEGILVLVIILVIFGAGKLPQVGKAMGEGIKNFRSASLDKEDKPKDDGQ
ncbi:MAG: twin-arginine translocase TatA/TatE family subunit [Thermincolia bacterium]